jgi:hypothetical protein
MRCGAVSFNPYQRTKTFATDRLYVYTDRGVYQPGEALHARIIGWRLKNDYAPLSSADVELLLRDQAGHSIAAKTGTTDEFGITAVDLPIPITAAAGDYDLRIAYGSERASTRIQIRRFAPPSFRTEHTLPRFLLRNRSGPLEFTVTLHPPASETLGKVKLAATAKAPGGKVIATIGATRTGNGPHPLKLAAKDVAQLIAATKEGELARIEIRARDDKGREVELARELHITGKPYEGLLELDRDQYSTGDPVAVVARISDLDGVPLRKTEVHLRVGKSSTPYIASTDDAGMARFALNMPSASTKLTLEVKGTEVAAVEVPWTSPKPMRTSVASPVIKERQKTQVVARFPAGYIPADRVVHMDIVDTSGGIIGSELLTVQKDKKGYLARGELVAPSWGSMLLTFFALGRNEKDKKKLGLLVSGQNLVVQTDRELEIQLEGLPKKGRPGAPLAVRAKVTTANGDPADVSVGAALVDRNVLSLKDPLEITPMDRFYNPELRTLATTGSKILTWPVVSRNWGESHLHDIALPPFEWKPAGDVASCRTHWDAADWKASPEKEPNGIGLGAMGAIGHGSGYGVARAHGKRAVITIRTRFPTTALWAPHLHGSGSVDIQGRLPDRIGEQELIVVASDKKGGVGMKRAVVDVSQPVFVQANVPTPAVVGETVKVPAIVRNGTKKSASFAVELGGAGAKKKGQITVAGQGTGAIDLPLRFDSVGKSQITVRAVGAGHDDRVIRNIAIVPRGVPITTVQHATLLPNKRLELALRVSADATGADAHLRLELPAITSAFAHVPTLAARIADDPWGLSSDLTAAAVVLQLADRFNVKSSEVKALRGRLIAALAMVRRVQQSDGGYAYWRNGKASPYITARVLDGMLEARTAGLPVPRAPIENAAGYIAKHLAGGDLVSTSDIGWWEGDSTKVREGLTAELFDVLSQVPEGMRNGAVNKALAKLTKRYQAYLAKPAIDPLAGGRALAALLRLDAIDEGETDRVIKSLVQQRDRGHWEPSWFHAYGGRIDATLAVLEALHLQDPVGRQADKRDALSWILSTRASWGAWHAEAATAAALRAMLLAGAAPNEVASTVTVRLDGRVVKTVVVDPKDPWKSTAALAHLDLGHLTTGKHEITIDYDGKLKPALSLVSRQWRPGSGSTAKRSGVVLRTAGPSTVQAGKRVDLIVDASGKHLAGGTLLIGNSSLLELDLGKLGTMTGYGRPVAGVVATDDSIALTLAPTTKSLSLALPWIALRRGKGHLPTIGLLPRKGAPLIVAPGALEVK